VVASEKLIDGLCVFVANHRERRGRGFKVKPQSIICAYRNKTKIEDVFKYVKSFLKIRPFFVNTEKHVKAVYSICMLAYFLNKFLANRREAAGEKDFLNSKELYAPFKDIDYVSLLDPQSGQTVTKSVELPQKTKSILENSKCFTSMKAMENEASQGRVVTESLFVTIYNNRLFCFESGIWDIKVI